MIKNNNRNSRDDKSKPGSRSTTGSGRSSRDGDSRNDARPKTSRSSEGTSDFKSRPPKEGDRKDSRPFNSRSSEGSSDFKSRPPRDGDRKDSRPFNSRSSEGSSDFKSRPPRDGDRKDSRPFNSRSSEGSSDFKSRPPRDGDRKDSRPPRDGDRKDSRPSRDGGKPFAPRSTGSKDFKPRAFKEGSSKDHPPKEGRSYIKKDNTGSDGERPFRNFNEKKPNASRTTDNRPFRKREDESGAKPNFKDRPERSDRPMEMRSRKTAAPKEDDGLIRLNRYISNAGICSRRKADELIAAGVVSVNGEVVSELGHKVDPGKDDVRYNGELLKREKKVYVLINKPKDYITTTDDPQERRTVMSLVEKASRERIYPVGRLDRNTTGLLLMTNDGDLADKLSHPKNGITKIYHVELSKSLSQGDLNKIQFGLELEDGLIKPDAVSYVAGGSKREVGIQIHSGKNRIVRRIFEHLGYDVVKLDRVVYGNLTKKDLPRGRWRYLEEHELIQIKHLIK
jgi:23S rRNA pseudouridine2605 synthase